MRRSDYMFGLFPVCFFVLFFAACKGDTPPDTEPEGSAGAVGFTASIANFTPTGANDPGAFIDGDAVGVYMVYGGTFGRTGNQINNGRFGYNGTQWSAGAGTFTWKDKTTAADFYAYYPYTAQVSSVEALPFAVRTDQNAPRAGAVIAAYEASDFLWGSAAGVSAGTKPGFSFKHAMGKVAVTIVRGTGIGESEFAALSKQVTIQNIVKDAVVNLGTGAATAAPGAAAATITPCREDDVTFKAVVVPQSVTSGTEWITVRAGDYSYTHTAAATLAAGMQQNIVVCVDGTGGGVLELRLQSDGSTRWQKDAFVHNAAPTTSTAEPLAFPGAEGFAAFTSGGRGGEVVYVTNLNDSGTGSFRAAVEGNATTPRTVLFKVGGTIVLKSDLEIGRSNLTIAGQSAPGGGICLRDYQVDVRGNNVIIRHMRFRSGEVTQREQQSVHLAACHDVIMDHCSVTWSVDECLSSNGIYNVTLQNCIIGEGLNNAGVHPKGDHSMGSLLNSKGGVSIIHSMYTTNNNRNPRAYNMLLDMRNNVVYNWGGLAYTSEHCAMVNMVDNYFLPGPATSRSGATRFFRVGNLQTRLHITGNVVINRNDNGENTEYSGTNNYKGVLASPWRDEIVITENDIANTVLVGTPYPAPALQNRKDPRTELFTYVMDNVGATLPRRDASDVRMVDNAKNRTGQIVDAVMPGADKVTIGGWPELDAGTAPADSDGDGMPDAWEEQSGLNKNSAADGKQDPDGDGYTNLEEYLNSTRPSVAESGHNLKKAAVKQLGEAAVAAVTVLQAEYDAAMNTLDWAKETLTTNQIKALIGKFTFDPALSTKPQQVKVRLEGYDDGNGSNVVMKMVRIPKGTFQMGMSDWEYNLPTTDLSADFKSKEWPRHQVTLTKDYYMAEVPTTNRQFKTLMLNTEGDIDGEPYGTTFTEAKQFARLLAGATGESFRLPTEAEWEYACRAGTTTAFHYGNTISSASVVFDGSTVNVFNPVQGTNREDGVDPYTLGDAGKNAWGLYAMHGNTFEYCEDERGWKYTSAPRTDPCHNPIVYGGTATNPTFPSGYNPNNNGTRVMRGGTAGSAARTCRSSYRYEYKDGVTYGSRVVMIIPN